MVSINMLLPKFQMNRKSIFSEQRFFKKIKKSLALRPYYRPFHGTTTF